MDYILKYFPNLTERQQAQFEQLDSLYREWNQKINVISRKDIDNLYLHHILHSLAIAKVTQFKPGAKVLDLGTGGGLPAIPLAILFPETTFIAIDGTRKKITVVNEIAQAAGLDNLTGLHQRVEDRKKREFDFVVTRAVALLEKLAPWSMRLIHDQQRHVQPNGLLALKGGKVKEELKALPRKTYSEIYPIADMFEEAFFAEKSVVYVQY